MQRERTSSETTVSSQTSSKKVSLVTVLPACRARHMRTPMTLGSTWMPPPSFETRLRMGSASQSPTMKPPINSSCSSRFDKISQRSVLIANWFSSCEIRRCRLESHEKHGFLRHSSEKPHGNLRSPSRFGIRDCRSLHRQSRGGSVGGSRFSLARCFDYD